VRVLTGASAPEAFTSGDPLLPSAARLTGTASGFCEAGAAMLACRVDRSWALSASASDAVDDAGCRGDGVSVGSTSRDPIFNLYGGAR
jgi:hypothetical protein